MMNSKITNAWVSIAALTCLAIGLSLCYLFYDQELIVSRQLVDNSLSAHLISALLFASIFEEIAFRGFFIKKKIWMIFSWIFLLVYVIFLKFSILNFILAALFLVLFVTYKIKRTKELFAGVVIANALLFAGMHYDWIDFQQPFTYGLLGLSLFGGFSMIWLVLRYNLLASMIFHLIWNGIFTGIMLFGLQYPESELKTYQSADAKLKVTWKPVPYFQESNAGVKMISEDEVKLDNLPLTSLYKWNYFTPPDSSKAYQITPFMKYEATFDFKDSLTKRQKDSLLNKFFENSRLIEFVKN